MTLRHTQVFLSLPPSISSCPSVSPHFLDALYSGSETLFAHGITVLNILNLKYTKKKAYVFSWVTELLVLFFYHIDKRVLVENKTPIKFIRNYIRGLSSIFSIPSPVSMTSFPAQTVICTHVATRHETNGER